MLYLKPIHQGKRALDRLKCNKHTNSRRESAVHPKIWDSNYNPTLAASFQTTGIVVPVD